MVGFQSQHHKFLLPMPISYQKNYIQDKATSPSDRDEDI